MDIGGGRCVGIESVSMMNLFLVFIFFGITAGTAPLPKCCPEGSFFLKSEKKCIASNHTLLHPFKPWEENPIFQYKMIECPGNETADFEPDEYSILENGNLFVLHSGETFTVDEYCFDVLQEDENYFVSPIICYDDFEDSQLKQPPLTHSIGILISIPFFTIAWIVYVILPELQNIPGLCFIQYIACVTLSYIILVAAQIFITPNLEQDYTSCIISVFGSVPIPKCCPLTQHVSKTECADGPFAPPWGTEFWKSFEFVFVENLCPDSDKVLLSPEEFNVSSNGTVYYENTLFENFCIDFFVGRDPNVSLVLCDPDIEESLPVAYSIGLIISIPFFLATLIIYLSFKRLHNVEGCILIAQVFSLLLGYTSLLIVNHFNEHIDLYSCFIIGFAVQFFFLATFFWLNVMCIDIYWAFSGFKLRGSASERDRKKLLAYSIYAWGMPLIILAATVGVDYYDAIPATSSFKPNMGKDKCFFKSRTATWTYFYGPMAVILFSNLILFAVTAFRIWRHRRETAVLQRGDSRRHDGNESERFNLYLKLFLVMGINWISELVSYMFGKDVPQYLWYVTDITNTLQGVFIFLIFVWKKRVRKLLWDKFKKKQANVNGSTMTASTALNGSMR